MSASGDRFRRFMRLERPRRNGPDGEERPSSAARIEGVEGERERERPGGPHPGVPGSSRDRFAPPPERPPDVQAPVDEEQPFIRCQRCEADNSRFARACSNCGEDLGTEAQREFNQKLWAERRREREALERENAGRRAAQAEAEAEAARARRLAAEELAREVGERERGRLERERGRWGGSWGGDPTDGPGGDATPVGIRLLRLIRSPLWRLAAIGGLVALVVLCLALARASPVALVVAISILIGLFTPRWRRRGWW